jgi:hypothetical protein
VSRDRVEDQQLARDPERPSPGPAPRAGVEGVLLALQRSAGNRAVSRLLSRQNDPGFSRVDLEAADDEPDILARFGAELALADPAAAPAPPAPPPGFPDPDPDPAGRLDLGGPAPAPATPATAGAVRFRAFSTAAAPASPAVAAPPAAAPALPPRRPAGAAPALPPRRPSAPAPAAPRRPATAAPAGLAGPQTRAVADARAHAAIRRALADVEHERRAAGAGRRSGRPSCSRASTGCARPG